jgi:hypothetical protein
MVGSRKTAKTERRDEATEALYVSPQAYFLTIRGFGAAVTIIFSCCDCITGIQSNYRIYGLLLGATHEREA